MDQEIPTEKQSSITEVFIEIRNKLVSQKIHLEREVDQRLVKAIEILLSYKPGEEAENWLLTPNENCPDEKGGFDCPIDLVNSGYSFRHLMRMIEWERYHNPEFDL